MTDFEPAHELAALGKAQDEIDAMLGLEAELLNEVAAERSGWSSLQHIAHVALANELVLRNLESLAKGKGMLIVHGGEPHPRVLGFLEAGRLPRGEAKAPRMVQPPAVVRPELLTQWLADGRTALAGLDPAQLGASELKIPHQLLGPLNAPQWARFAVVHMNHHLAIVHEILADLDPDGAS